MPYLADWTPTDPIQILIYGKSKIGKTWGAYTFPRPVVMDFDHGAATARNPEFVKRYGLRNIFFEEFREKNLVKGVPQMYNAYDDACRFFDEWMKPSGKWSGSDGKVYNVGRDQFDTWVIDSGTTLSEFAQYKAVIVMGKMKLSKTHEESLKMGLIVPKIQDYGSERSLVEQFVDMVKSSGKNVVLICHEKEILNDAGIITDIVPLLTGKSVENIPLKFDEVYNLRSKKQGTEIIRYLQTEADGVRKVGSRYGIPNESQWDWDSVYKALSGIKSKQRAQADLAKTTNLVEKKDANHPA